MARHFKVWVLTSAASGRWLLPVWCREKGGFSPDLLVVDGAVWHLAHDKNLALMAAEAEQLRILVERARNTVSASHNQPASWH